MSNNCYRPIFIFFILSVAVVVHAQRIRLNAYGSYVLDGTYHIYYKNGDFYEGNTTRGPQWGFGVEYMASEKYGVEFSCLNRNTKLFHEGTMSNDRRNTDLNLNYFLLGINAYPQSISAKLQSFGGISAGMIKQCGYSTNEFTGNSMNTAMTKFTWAARVGGIYWISCQAGIKLQAQWLSSLQFNNGVTNFDVYGSGFGPVDYSIANQFELGSGLIIKLGKPSDKD